MLSSSFQFYFFNGGILTFVQWLPQHLTTFSSSLIGYRFNTLDKFSNVCSQCCFYILSYPCKTIVVHIKGYSSGIYRSIWKLFCQKRQSYAIPGFHFEEKNACRHYFPFLNIIHCSRYTLMMAIIEFYTNTYIFSYVYLLC